MNFLEKNGPVLQLGICHCCGSTEGAEGDEHMRREGCEGSRAGSTAVAAAPAQRTGSGAPAGDTLGAPAVDTQQQQQQQQQRTSTEEAALPAGRLVPRPPAAAADNVPRTPLGRQKRGGLSRGGRRLATARQPAGGSDGGGGGGGARRQRRRHRPSSVGRQVVVVSRRQTEAGTGEPATAQLKGAGLLSTPGLAEHCAACASSSHAIPVTLDGPAVARYEP
jgi:hypothetical protein